MNESTPPTPARPSHAESARTLLAAASRGVLSTLDREEGHPYGSLVEYLAADNGDALLFVSDLAEHTANFKADSRASLAIPPGMAHRLQGVEDRRPLAAERVTLVGEIVPVDRPDDLRAPYLDEHPHAAVYIDFSDFAFWRLRVDRVRYIGGFGRMSWVDAADYRAAAADPLVDMADGAIRHMNRDHPDALADCVRAFTDAADVDAVRMVSVDRFGFAVQIRDGAGHARRARLCFDAPLNDGAEVRPAMVEMTRRARERL